MPPSPEPRPPDFVAPGVRLGLQPETRCVWCDCAFEPFLDGDNDEIWRWFCSADCYEASEELDAIPPRSPRDMPEWLA
jgi:hypothetical protein